MQTEAVVSIFLSTMYESEEAIYGAIIGLTYNGQPVDRSFGHKLKFDDSDEYAIVVSDKKLTDEEARAFYDDIMEYHHAKDELPEEEIAVRDEEVKTKWLNGNFNWWAIGAGKVDSTEINEEFAGISYCSSNCAKCKGRE